MNKSYRRPAVAIIGGGSIGTGWAIAFAVGGHDVRVFDSDPERLVDARQEVLDRLDGLEEFGLLSGTTVGVR